MKPTLATLKRSAAQATKHRGHRMGHWKPDPFWTTVWHRKCKICGKGVQVDTNPPPNGIDICGEAVALGCKD